MMHEPRSAGVTTTADIDAAIGYACSTGLLPMSGRDQMTARIHALLSSAKVREWFDGSCSVMTEATVLLPTGAARRPDRVMIRNNTVTVVDYKFGEPSPGHRRQAAGYRELLQQMGFLMWIVARVCRKRYRGGGMRDEKNIPAGNDRRYNSSRLVCKTVPAGVYRR